MTRQPGATAPSAQSAAFDVRLQLLRALLFRAGQRSALSGNVAQTAAEAQPLFLELLSAWEAVSAAEVAKAAEEAELFKTKVRASSFRTEEVLAPFSPLIGAYEPWQRSTTCSGYVCWFDEPVVVLCSPPVFWYSSDSRVVVELLFLPDPGGGRG